MRGDQSAPLRATVMPTLIACIATSSGLSPRILDLARRGIVTLPKRAPSTDWLELPLPLLKKGGSVVAASSRYRQARKSVHRPCASFASTACVPQTRCNLPTPSWRRTLTRRPSSS